MYIGLDVHKGITHYAMVDGEGTVVKRGRFRTTSEGLDEFVGILPEDAKVAIERLIMLLPKTGCLYVLNTL